MISGADTNLATHKYSEPLHRRATVVSSAPVLARDETQQARETATNDLDGYNFATVPPGTYNL